jgi:hypothetical protein
VDGSGKILLLFITRLKHLKGFYAGIPDFPATEIMPC